jgi:superfamily I DNA/RNA helicase
MDGPVLVVAGPGTGKTQILAARIGKILTDTDAQPNEILCLTYTDAGAVAMRKRLFEFIGPMLTALIFIPSTLFVTRSFRKTWSILAS